MKKNRKALFGLVLSAMMLLASCAGGTPNNASSGGGAISASESLVPSSSTGGGGQTGQSTSDPNDPSSSAPASIRTVTFNLNYSGSRPIQVRVNDGETVERPDDPSREGFSFTGWYTEIACVNLFDFETRITRNLVLFAGWEAANVTVSYNFNYVGAPAMVTQTVTKGSLLDPIDDPERDYYAFVTWCIDAAGETPFDFTAPINESITLYAKWRLAVAVVTFDLNYDVEGKITTQNVDVGDPISAPVAPEREGYEFKGWFADGAASAFDFTTPIENNLTLTAKWEIIVLTVTFDFADGRESIVVNVNYGDTVAEQANVKDGFTTMWTLDGAEFIFTTPITSSIVLIATYTKQSSDKVTFTYHLNYTGAPNEGIFATAEVTKGERPANPGAPERNNAIFSGWYLDAACTQVLNFVTTRAGDADVDVYARWLVKNRFEAEYVDLENKVGHGFSVNTGGVDMIYDDNGTGASNGYYVSDLYYQGAFIQFDITSDRAVNDAILTIAVQVEWDTKTFNPELYQITVNGVSLDYNEFTIEGFALDSQQVDRRPFIEVEMNDPAVLNKGVNVVKLITANDIYHGGTRQGDAPMIDYIDIYTDATLSWNPKTDNPSRRGQ